MSMPPLRQVAGIALLFWWCWGLNIMGFDRCAASGRRRRRRRLSRRPGRRFKVPFRTVEPLHATPPAAAAHRGGADPGAQAIRGPVAGRLPVRARAPSAAWPPRTDAGCGRGGRTMLLLLVVTYSGYYASDAMGFLLGRTAVRAAAAAAPLPPLSRRSRCWCFGWPSSCCGTTRRAASSARRGGAPRRACPAAGGPCAAGPAGAHILG